MPEFHIIWEIDVHADDPVEAARKAFSLVRKPDSSANCFDVIPHDNVAESVRVDLEVTGIDRENDMPRRLVDALEDLLEEAENTSAFEDAERGEDDAMLNAVNKARSVLGLDPVEVVSDDDDDDDDDEIWMCPNCSNTDQDGSDICPDCGHQVE